MAVTLVEFKVWKTIKIGTGIVSVRDFQESVRDLNESDPLRDSKLKIKLSDNAEDVLGRPGCTFASRCRMVDLVKVSLRQLSLESKVSRDRIYQRAREFRLRKCPPEVGPQLRVQYLDQPRKERLVIGMDPVKSRRVRVDDPARTRFDGYQDLFLVDRDDATLWLRAVPGNLNGQWDGEFEWVFVIVPKTIPFTFRA